MRTANARIVTAIARTGLSMRASNAGSVRANVTRAAVVVGAAAAVLPDAATGAMIVAMIVAVAHPRSSRLHRPSALASIPTARSLSWPL